MAKSTAFSNYLLGLIFQGGGIPGLAQDAAAPLTSLYLSLHTSALGVGDAQDAHETTYSGYIRKAVARTPDGFTLASNRVTLPTVQAFGECMVASPQILTHWAIGVAASGATMVLWSGPLNDTLEMVLGATPRLSALTYVDET